MNETTAVTAEIVSDDPLAAAVAAIPSCALTPAGLARQRERHAHLARQTTAVRTTETNVIVEFAARFDREVLDEMVAVERECCPFFTSSFEDDSRRLVIGIKKPEQAPALAVLAEALSVGAA